MKNFKQRVEPADLNSFRKLKFETVNGSKQSRENINKPIENLNWTQKHRKNENTMQNVLSFFCLFWFSFVLDNIDEKSEQQIFAFSSLYTFSS